MRTRQAKKSGNGAKKSYGGVRIKKLGSGTKKCRIILKSQAVRVKLGNEGWEVSQVSSGGPLQPASSPA